MESLLEKAKKIKDVKAKIEQGKIDKLKEEAKALENELLEEFKIGFIDQLSLLEKEGITYSAHLQDFKYSFKGTYILFSRNNKSVKMDFGGRGKYRYEFVPYDPHYRYRGKSTYGNWNKEGFILFLAENLY